MKLLHLPPVKKKVERSSWQVASQKFSLGLLLLLLLLLLPPFYPTRQQSRCKLVVKLLEPKL